MRFASKLVAVTATTVVATAAGIGAATRISPWPGVWFLRWIFGRAAVEPLAAQAAVLHEMLVVGIESELDIPYLAGRPAARLDVHRPTGDGPRPTVVWIHGGGYVGGTKDDLHAYLRVLAGYGFTTVGVDYTHAPERAYPTQIDEVGAALAFLVDHAERYGIDPDQIVLGGDSAGAHIACQAGFAIADPAYASAAGLSGSIPADSLRGLLLCCGSYRLIGQRVPGVMGFVVRTALWAYTGERDPSQSPRFAFASVATHVPPNLPPTYVTCGNDDPLLPHSRELVDALEATGVDTDVQIYGQDHPTQLPHEYQFDLRFPEATEALERMVALVHRVSTVRSADESGTS